MDIVLFSELEKQSKQIISKHVNNFLKDKTLNLKDADFIIDYLNKGIMDELSKTSKNFKFIIYTIIFKSDNLVYSNNCSAYFDIETDGIISEKFVFKNIGCLITLFCCSI